MSRYFTEKFKDIVPYTPGEQPAAMKYIKLNTNESPFPPSEGVADAVKGQVSMLQLYSDPECRDLRKTVSETFNVKPGQVMMVNGSDEALYLAFKAFSDENNPVLCPEISYGFYPVYASINRIPYNTVQMDENLQIDPSDFMSVNKTICIANPNAPTGQFISVSDIEKIVRSNPDNVVIIDEAYVEFGGESSIPLTAKYDNILVVRTFSKSHSLAGARLGFAIGSEDLISDLNTLRYSINPYNVNRMSSAAGVAALKDEDYYQSNCRIIEKNREWTTSELKKLGFEVLPSKANFILAKSGKTDGSSLYEKLKSKGILVRHFSNVRVSEFIRVTIGSMEQMQAFIKAVKEIENC